VGNIVCTQPFGCLPNHICGKGMMKPIKEKNPNVNIVAIDYDAGATKVNQENRLKLMLANARQRREEESVNAAVSSLR
jgi:predicted nucleotide-binding protein (sugar kinase/HSP70/actin superfamily)